MWEDDTVENKNNISDLKFNKKFAQKFEHRKKREEIEKAKLKHGKDLNKMLDDDLSGSESSSATEDEDGDLLTDKERVNFIKTIAKIREKVPEIYQDSKNFWNDDMFDKEVAAKKEKENPVYYKDLARQALTEENKPRKTVRELHDEEQGRLKDAFKQAAGMAEGEDDLFKVKQKTQQQIEDENKEFEKFIKAESKKSRPEEVDMLQRFWGDESKLDDTDKFLRKYIMTNGWVDKEKDKFNFSEADEEDERRDEEMDEFEEKYNFRFEEPGADQVVTHGREVQDSIRQKDDKRKEKRKEKEERKKDLVKEEQENLKRLKNIMKQEVMDRLKKVKEIAGSEVTNKDKFNKILDKDFDPKDYDQLMNEEFGEDYYENEDLQEQELEEYVEEREKQYDEVPEENKDEEEPKKAEPAAKNGKQSKGEVDDTLLEPKAAIPIYNRVGIKETEAKEIADSIGHLWWYCDTCFRGIHVGEPRFECLECQDFCQCKQCADMRDHTHKMKRFIVPQGCPPPSDQEIQRILNDMKFCAECNYKFTEFDFINELKQNKEFLLCEDCVKNNQKQYKEKDFNKIKPSKVDTDNIAQDDLEKLKDVYNDQELHKLIDSYYALDFEDVISGGLKTRFKYIGVSKNAYGLTDEELLYADDKKLNQFVSLKKMMPYKEDDKVNMKARSRMKHEVKKDAERTKKEVDKDARKIAKLEESGLSKSEIQKKKQHINDIRNMIDKHAKKKVKLLTEKDIEGLDFDNEDEMAPAEVEEPIEPEKTKKRKLNSSRLKSYGLE